VTNQISESIIDELLIAVAKSFAGVYPAVDQASPLELAFFGVKLVVRRCHARRREAVNGRTAGCGQLILR
jgi:hypothetical protein